MMENYKKVIFTLLLIGALLIAAFIPGKMYFTHKTFKEALAFNKAKSNVTLKIMPVFKGKTAKADKMFILGLDNSYKAKEKFAVQSFKSSISKTVLAKWLDVKFEGFDKKGNPQYDYKFSVKRYEVTVIDTKDSLIGTTIVSFIPDKPVLEAPVKVNMKKTNFNKEKSTAHLLSDGGGYTEIEEYKDDIYNFTKIASLHSANQERSQMVFPRGSIVYIQSKSRGDAG